MKPSIKYSEYISQTKEKINRATQNGLFLKKYPRIRPRTEAEKELLCQAVVYTIAQAKRTGKLRKLEKGYCLSWKN